MEQAGENRQFTRRRSAILRPAAGPEAMDTAIARFNSATGPGATRPKASYSVTICSQSVSSAFPALQWHSAMAACSP